MMQAFAYHHLVPAKDWLAEVTGVPRPNARDAFKIEAEAAIKLPRGGTVPVHVLLNAPRLADSSACSLTSRRRASPFKPCNPCAMA